MRYLLGFSALLGLLCCGCTPAPVAQSGGNSSVTTDGGEAAPVSSDPAEATSGSESAAEPSSEPSTLAPATGEATPPAEPAAATESAARAAVVDGVVKLSPENTTIQFTGTHTGDKPDPRVGTFAKLSGEVKVDADAKALNSVSVEIESASLTTPIEKLTTHLHSEEFLDVRQYDTIKFESSEVTAGEGGQVTIKGNLTLHGQTKEISFPATVKIDDAGFALQADFSIDRSQFGIEYGLDKIDDKVSLSVSVGKAATP